MSKLMKWIAGIGAMLLLIGGGAVWVGSNTQHPDKKATKSVTSHKKATKNSAKDRSTKATTTTDETKQSSQIAGKVTDSKKDDASSVSSSETESQTQATTKASETSEKQAQSASATTSAKSNTSQSVQGNPQGAVQSDPNTYVTTPGAAKAAVATHMRQVQGFDPNRFTLSAHPGETGEDFTVNVTSSQIKGTIAVYHVATDGTVSQVQ